MIGYAAMTLSIGIGSGLGQFMMQGGDFQFKFPLTLDVSTVLLISQIGVIAFFGLLELRARQFLRSNKSVCQK